MANMYNHVGVPVLIGRGAVGEVGAKAKSFGCSKVLIIHDKNLKEMGMIDKLANALDKENIGYICFDGVLPDPPDATVEAAATIARSENVDGIIAIGGGSALDTGKAVNVLINNPSPIQQYFKPGMKLKAGVPSILIPTTSGTGSEVTSMTIVTDSEDNGAKRTVNNPVCLATLAIVDPELSYGMPASLTTATGMDAFSHAAEALTCSVANPLIDAFCREAIRMIAQNLVRAVKNGADTEARENMSCAATLAGIAFTNVRVHLGHSIGHVLGAAYHIPHGIACALTVPAVVRWACRYLPEKVRMIGEAMGCAIPADATNEEIGNITADAIQALSKEIGVATMKEVGIKKEELKNMVPLVKSQGTFIAKPGPISDEELLDILYEAYEGKTAVKK